MPSAQLRNECGDGVRGRAAAHLFDVHQLSLRDYANDRA